MQHLYSDVFAISHKFLTKEGRKVSLAFDTSYFSDEEVEAVNHYPEYFIVTDDSIFVKLEAEGSIPLSVLTEVTQSSPTEAFCLFDQATNQVIAGAKDSEGNSFVFDEIGELIYGTLPANPTEGS